MARLRPPAAPPVSTPLSPSPLPPAAPPAVEPPVVRRETLPVPITHPSPTLDRPPTAIAESHQLPPHQTKWDRVTGHLAALSADLTEWVELRVDLVKRQVEGLEGQFERIQHYLDSAPFFVLGLALALSGVMFVFVAVAFAVGWMVGSLGWGFFITAVLLLIGGAVFGWLGLRRVKRAEAEAAEARKLERDQQHRTRDDIQQSEREAAQNAAV